MSSVLRLAGAMLLLALTTTGFPAPAFAAGPPTIDDGALGAAIAASRGGSPDATEQRSICAEPKLAGVPPRDPPQPQRLLDLPGAWQFSRGAGQKVAVVDTGVNRHPRLRAVQPGGDFVSNSDGTDDCDGHGTLVAGLIAAQPSPEDGFAGVAPDAEILAIRQLSLAFEAKDRGRSDEPGKIASAGYGNVMTLAASVVRAVDMGATVVNISEVACAAGGSDPTDATLGAAVKYAYDRNVVVVTAAGNIQQGGACAAQNDGTGWAAVKTVVSPAWFTPYVLPVASVDPDGKPSDFSIHGPWVGVAAPGRGIVSLDSKPGAAGVVDSVQTSDGTGSIDGTSFSSAYVSGLAALVRARFPQLSAQQVMDRITRTAMQPGAGRDDRLGAGLIDPVAALTAQLPAQPIAAGADVARPLPAPPPPPYVDPVPGRVAIIGTLVLLALLAIGFALSIPFRGRRNRIDPAEEDREGL